MNDNARKKHNDTEQQSTPFKVEGSISVPLGTLPPLPADSVQLKLRQYRGNLDVSFKAYFSNQDGERRPANGVRLRAETLHEITPALLEVIMKLLDSNP